MTNDATIIVTISGEQGSGKTLVADIVADAVLSKGFKFTKIDGDWTEKGYPETPGNRRHVVIKVRQQNETELLAAAKDLLIYLLRGIDPVKVVSEIEVQRGS